MKTFRTPHHQLLKRGIASTTKASSSATGTTTTVAASSLYYSSSMRHTATTADDLANDVDGNNKQAAAVVDDKKKKKNNNKSSGGGGGEPSSHPKNTNPWESFLQPISTNLGSMDAAASQSASSSSLPGGAGEVGGSGTTTQKSFDLESEMMMMDGSNNNNTSSGVAGNTNNNNDNNNTSTDNNNNNSDNDSELFSQHHQSVFSSSNIIEEEDQGLVFAAELLCDDLLNCKTEVLRQFARSRGGKAIAKANMVSELIEVASKTVSNPGQRSVARRILGSDIELPKSEGVRSAWTNETLEASMLENAASKKAKFSQQNFGANLRATSVRVSPISQRLLRALQDDFSAVSHAAVKGVHREYVESAKSILQTHENQLPSLVAVFSTLLAYRVEQSEVQEFISSADIQSRAVYLGLNRPTIESDVISSSSSSSNNNNTSSSGAAEGQQQESTSGNNSLDEDPANINNNNTSELDSSSSSSSSGGNLKQAPSTTLDHLMSMLDDVVADVKLRQAEFALAPQRQVGSETRTTFRRSISSFKQRQVALKRDSVAIRRALADVPQWVVEMARQFEVWETLVRSDIEDLRRAPAEIFDLVLVNVAASVAAAKLHAEEEDHNNNSNSLSGNMMGGGAGVGGGGDGTGGSLFGGNNNNGSSSSSVTDLFGSSATDASSSLTQNTVPPFYRQALRDAIEDFSDEGTADTIILRLNAYAAGKAAFAVNRPILRQNLFNSIQVMMHGMVTDDISDPPFERVASILQEFTKTIHRSERVASVYQSLVQLTETLHFHLRFAAVFPLLGEQDKSVIRKGSRSLQVPLANFEQQQGITPLPVSGVAFFCIVMMYFCIRAPNTVATSLPIATRLESCTGIDELAVISLTGLKALNVRSLGVSHPPRMTYTSWIDSDNNNNGSNNNNNSSNSNNNNSDHLSPADVDSTNKGSSSSGGNSSSSSAVYRLLPSEAVKSSTSNLMLTSRAPIIRSLDAISRVPWRINKMMLHVQEAILQEGYAFGKIRSSFYPLSYARLPTGEITVASPYGGGGGGEDNNNNNNNNNIEQQQQEGKSSTKKQQQQFLDEINNDSSNPHKYSVYGYSKTKKLFSHRLHRKYVEEQNNNWRELLDTRSPRVHHIQALRQARALVNVAKIYFPNNMDFRGRMYPMPGRLNHTGSDPFRASLEFADPKPLGPDGLYWLKVHLANKMGQTKLSFADRVRWVDEHISDVVQSAESPLSGDRWWQEGDEPFQALNACKELADALKHSSGPENFLSRLPVAVDGSYNGLQHYSAIGRDAAGGALVNLVPQKLPSDAYTGILKEMMKEIIADAAKDHAVAQRCIGSGKGMDKNHVRRKTIKQSIMTQVYGVTDYGMAEQIQTQLQNQNKAHGLWTNAEITEMSSYLRDKVNESLGVTFRQTQECRSWLAQVSALIWKCQPAELRNAFSWTTPLGLIVRQPYRKGIETSVFTPVGYTRIKGSPLEPASPKQMSALAPNLIHSLDATHLAMTALEMQNLGLSMMAVHDSFWTYACDLPTLSRVLREQFLELYTNFDPLVEAKQQWEEMFFLDLRRHSVVLPDPPKRGTLDLKQVLKSPYFFS